MFAPEMGRTPGPSLSPSIGSDYSAPMHRPSTRYARSAVARGRKPPAVSPARRSIVADGFIHFSTADQARRPRPRHFAGQDRPAAGRRRCRPDWATALKYEVVARRRAVPASLRRRSTSPPCDWVQAAAARRRRPASFPDAGGRDERCSTGSASRLLFAFDPETAHGLSIAALKCGLPVAGSAAARRRG